MYTSDLRESEQKKAVPKQLNGFKLPRAISNLRPHKKEQASIRTSAHSECAAQQNRYAISELRERLQNDILLTSILEINTAGLSVSYKLGPRWDNVITWSDFKSETSLGFLSPNYTGQCT